MPAPVLVNDRGLPEPSPEIARRLRQVDPRLFLAKSPFAYAWQIRQTWAEGDPRWRLAQEGHLDPTNTFDIVGTLPLECSVEEAPAYLARQFGEVRDAGERQRWLDKVARFNASGEAQRAEVEEAVEATVEAVVAPKRRQGTVVRTLGG